VPTLEEFAPHRLRRVKLRAELRELYRRFLRHREKQHASDLSPCTVCWTLWREMQHVVRVLHGREGRVANR